MEGSHTQYTEEAKRERMTFIDIIWNFLGFWLIIHALIFFLRFLIGKKPSPWRVKKSSISSPSILPVTSNHHAPYHNKEIFGLETGTFSLRWTTTIFNPMFHICYQLWPKYWDIWFSIGVWFGFLAMAAGLLLLIIAGWRISVFSLNIFGQIFFSDSHPSSTHISTKLTKRTFEESDYSVATEANSGQIFIPVIPGITLPLSHLGYYLIALLTSGIIHEAGHAIAAVSERVPINSSGMFLMGFYPGAFVDLSSRSLSLLSPFRQLRVICAGVWHNFTFFIVLWLVLRWGLKLGFQLTGWKNLESVGGVSVVNISPTSALYERLPISSVIYRLDDFILNRNIESWNAFLLGDDDTPASAASGFCADLQTAHNSLDCCEISTQNPFGKSTNNSLACFEIYQNKYAQLAGVPEEISQSRFCFNTLDILAANPPRERCESSMSCHASTKQPSNLCIKPYTPYETARVLRLYYRDQLWREDSTDRIMVFVGDRVDIWESVQVSILQPRWSFLPVWLPGVIELILSYTSSFTLALSVLNILPATKLDGQHAIVCILSVLHPHEDIVLSANTRSRRRIERFIVSGTTILIGFVIVGSMIVGITKVGSTND